MKRWHECAAVLGLLMISANVLSAQPKQPGDDGWLAWQGCWHAYGDPVDNLLCIVPDGDGARMVNVVRGAVQSETRIIADGRARPVSLEGCTGTEKAMWSKDAQRLFLSSDMTCGERTHRRVTSIMAMPTSSDFVNVQAVTSGNTPPVTRTMRYASAFSVSIPDDIAHALQANRLARETARYAASSKIDLEDVSEAVHAVDAEVVNEWLVNMNQRFDLSGQKLLQLANAGVPSSTIDVLVAVSNPEHFAVKTADKNDVAPYRDRARGYDPCYDYIPWDGGFNYGYGYGYGYGRYYGRNSYYSPYNGCYYSPWGYDGWGWRGGTVIVIRDGNGEGAPRSKATRGGYTGSGSSRGSAKPRDEGTPSRSTTSTSSSRPADTGRASGGGYSSGSSGSSGSSSSGSGHTAHPKDK